MLAKDAEAAIKGDPACKSTDEVIFCYPGFDAIVVYRVARTLWELGVPLIPRIMTEIAHSRTGVDIHPGAKIGEYFLSITARASLLARLAKLAIGLSYIKA